MARRLEQLIDDAQIIGFASIGFKACDIFRRWGKPTRSKYSRRIKSRGVAVGDGSSPFAANACEMNASMGFAIGLADRAKSCCLAKRFDQGYIDLREWFERPP